MDNNELGTNLAEVGTDCISRQAAIDALRTCYDTETITMDNGDEFINYGDAVGEIEQLSPIHPYIVRCKDCKHRDPEDKKCDCGHDIQWQLPRQDDWFCADAERREQ